MECVAAITLEYHFLVYHYQL